MGPTLLTVSLVALSTSLAMVLGVSWGLALVLLQRGALPSHRSATPHSLGRTSCWHFALNFFERLQRLAAIILSRISLLGMLSLIALPLYVHAAGWESATGKFGWLPIFAGGQRYWFQGMTAAVWVHAGYGTGWIGMATLMAFQHPSSLIWQASRLDADWLCRVRFIGLPMAIPLIVATSIWVALIAATEMTVADLYGVNTLSDMVYKFYAFDPRMGPLVYAVLLPMVLFLPMAIMLSRPSKFPRANNSVERKSVATEVRSGRSLVFCGLLCAAMCILFVVVPLGSLVVKAGWTVTGDAQGNSGYSFTAHQFSSTLLESLRLFTNEFYWTLQLIIFSILTSIPIGWVLASTCEANPRWATGISVVLLSAVAVPGPVVSFAMITLFNRPSLAPLYDQSLLPTLLCIMTRTVPILFFILRGAYHMRSRELNAASQIDGARWYQRILLVDLPTMVRPLILGTLAVALITLADLSSTLLVLPPSVSTIATRIFGLLHSGVRYQEAGLALLSVLAVWLMALSAFIAAKLTHQH